MYKSSPDVQPASLELGHVSLTPTWLLTLSIWSLETTLVEGIHGLATVCKGPLGPGRIICCPLFSYCVLELIFSYMRKTKVCSIRFSGLSDFEALLLVYRTKTRPPLFFKKYILLIMLLQLSHFPPFTPLHPAHPLPPTFPPYSSCPWVIHIGSLPSTFPILFLPSPCLFSTYHLCYLFSIPFPTSPPPTPLLITLPLISISVMFLF